MISPSLVDHIKTLFPEPSDQDELAIFLEIIPVLEKELAGRYEIIDKLGRGGSGIVLKVRDVVLDVPRALKCARPCVGKEILLNKILGSEINKLRGVSHPNIITLFHFGEVEAHAQKWPYYVMEFVEGGRDLNDFIGKNCETLSESDLIFLIRQLVDGCLHLHRNRMCHGDVKLENALVAPDLRLKLSDLGSARYISGTDTTHTVLVGTYRYFHPRYIRDCLVNKTEGNRASMDRRRMDIKIDIDFYALGQNIIRILSDVGALRPNLITPYVRNYLNLLAARLLDGENMQGHPWEEPLGLTVSALLEIRYTSLEEVVEDLKKLSGEVMIASAVPELDIRFPNKIQCSYYSPCAFTARLEKLMGVPVLKRLAEVSQLGVVAFIYPTANHSRLEHSLGVYAMTIEYCNALWNDPINPFFKQVVTPKWIRTLLCAALTHDIGQYGLAHDFEESDPAIFNHTAFTKSVLKGKVANSVWEPLHEILRADWDVDPDTVAAILSASSTDYREAVIVRLLHSIIDGPIDADKADYLLRDSRKLGLAYGEGVDYSRLVNSLTVTFEKVLLKGWEKPQLSIAMGVSEKGRLAAESMAFARYALFGSVYWHHTSRALKSMLHRAIADALSANDGAEQKTKFKHDFEVLVVSKVMRQRLQLELDFCGRWYARWTAAIAAAFSGRLANTYLAV